MAETRFEDSVEGGNELNGLYGPPAAQRLEDLFDAVQTEFEKRWSLAYGFFAVPSVSLDEGGQKVDVTVIDGVLDGKRLTTAGFALMTGKPAGTYYLQAKNDSTYVASTTQNAAYSTIATFAWDAAATPKLSTLAVVATQGINFKGQTAQLSQWVPRGTWTTAFAYRGNSTFRDVVTYNGSCYVAKSDHTSGASSEPGVGGSWTTYWQLLAQKGATGSPGPAGGLTVPKGDWVAGVAYDASNPDTVVGSDGNGYQCILDHTSSATDEPGVGVNQATYWTRYVNAGGTGAQGDPGAGFTPQGAWVTSTAYAITPNIDWVTHNGNSYACILAHTSGATSEPGVGVDWATYWQQLSAKGAPGDPMDWKGAWVTSTAYTEGQGVTRLGSSYYCKLAHTAGAANEPGVGASWTTYWDYLALKGTDGVAGRTLLSGSGEPAGGTGSNGDFYIDTTAWTIYGPKTGGAWGSGTDMVGIGTDGTDGKGFNLRGAWLTSTAYATATDYDVVTNNGSAYACIVGHTSGSDADEPGVGANWGTYWQLLVVSAGGISIVTTIGETGSDGNIPSEQAVREEFTAHTAAYTHHKDNDAATAAPGATDDAGDGYSVGSRWIDTVAGTTYTCVDATEGAAVWKQEDGGGGAGAFTDLTDAPAAYTGMANKAVTVKGDESGLEFTDPAAGGGNPSPNLLINPEFAIDQRGGGTVRSLLDDTYGIDRWVGLNFTTTTIARIASGLNTSNTAARLVISGIHTQSGLLQIIESSTSLPYRGQELQLQARVRFNGNTTIYWAILEWTGTADSVTSDIVNDWTSGSKTAGQFFLGSNLVVAATGTQAVTANTWTALSGSGTISTGCNNLMVMIWAESTGTFDITECDLFAGSAGRTWQPPRRVEDIRACQWYFRKSYNLDTVPGTSTNDGLFQTNVLGVAVGNGSTWRLGMHPQFDTPMRIVPAVTLYTYNGTVGQWTIGSGALASAAGYISDRNFVILNNTGGSSTPTAQSAYGHWTADAEL